MRLTPPRRAKRRMAGSVMPWMLRWRLATLWATRDGYRLQSRTAKTNLGLGKGDVSAVNETCTFICERKNVVMEKKLISVYVQISQFRNT